MENIQRRDFAKTAVLAAGAAALAGTSIARADEASSDDLLARMAQMEERLHSVPTPLACCTSLTPLVRRLRHGLHTILNALGFRTKGAIVAGRKPAVESRACETTLAHARQQCGCSLQPAGAHEKSFENKG